MTGSSSKPRILVLSLGGTWCMAQQGAAGRPGDDNPSNGYAPKATLIPHAFGEDYDITQEFEALAAICEPHFFQIQLGSAHDGSPTRALDSTNLGPSHWAQVATFVAGNADSFDGFVVMQGTDTLAYTSAALAFALQGLNKPVVLSGAQISKNEPGSDAPSNVVNAFRVASLRDDSSGPVLREVAVVFGSRIIRATRCRKYSERDLEAFDTVNVPLLGRIRLQIRIDPTVVLKRPARAQSEGIQEARFANRVSLVYLYPGMRPEILESIGRASTGLVLAGFGAGNVPCSTDEYVNPLSLIHVVDGLVRDGLPVVVTTQCVTGQAEVGLYEAGNEARKVGAIIVNDMTPEAAYVKLSWLLANEQAWPKKALKALRGGPGRLGALKHAMLTDLAGEVTENPDLRGHFGT